MTLKLTFLESRCQNVNNFVPRKNFEIIQGGLFKVLGGGIYKLQGTGVYKVQGSENLSEKGRL